MNAVKGYQAAGTKNRKRCKVAKEHPSWSRVLAKSIGTI